LTHSAHTSLVARTSLTNCCLSCACALQATPPASTPLCSRTKQATVHHSCAQRGHLPLPARGWHWCACPLPCAAANSCIQEGLETFVPGTMLLLFRVSCCFVAGLCFSSPICLEGCKLGGCPPSPASSCRLLLRCLALCRWFGPAQGLLHTGCVHPLWHYRGLCGCGEQG
jgi:hypothetical protein